MTKMLDVNEKLNVSYCIPMWLRDEQVRVNTANVKGRIAASYDIKPDPIAIVCFGPSLNDTWEQVRNFKYVITCSGAHRFLIDKGIIPTHHVEVDPRIHKIKLLGLPHKDVEYLIASTCHPDYFKHLEGFNVKLWHVFDPNQEPTRVLPPGEWSITGGCGAGLRAMTIARFLGFQKLHVFGMDGSEGPTGKHASAHPNQAPDHSTVEYDGKTYKTTTAFLEAARQTWHELDQMPDVTATFYGEGLVQAMSKNYKRKEIKGGTQIAFVKPELISPEYRELNVKLHNENLAYGVGGAKHAETVMKLAESIKSTSVLDYGCLDKDSLIVTEDGEKTIKSICESDYSGNVISYNGNEFVWKKVINRLIRKDLNKRWIGLKAGNQKMLTLTADHPCAVIKNLLCPAIEFKPAEETKNYYVVRKPRNLENPLWNKNQISVVIGCMLGDAGIRKDGLFYVTHGEKQEGYLKSIHNIVGGRITDHDGDEGRFILNRQVAVANKGFRLLTPINAQTKYIRELMYPAGVKTPRNIMDYIDEIALAYWYMDDGQISRNKYSWYKGKRSLRVNSKPTARLHTEGFSLQDNKLICAWFKKTWNLEPTIYIEKRKDRTNHIISFKTADSEKLWSLIAPYIHEDLKYKLPESHWTAEVKTLNNDHLTVAASKITLKELPTDDRLYYDIEVEDTHNFISNGYLVHNCGKGLLAKSLPFPIWEYDPAVPGKEETPRPADLVVCTDVLEHVEPEKIDDVLNDLMRCVRKIGFFTIHTGPSRKFLADGRNAHILQRDLNWWSKKLESRFNVGKIFQVGPELYIVVSPKQFVVKQVKKEVKSNG